MIRILRYGGKGFVMLPPGLQPDARKRWTRNCVGTETGFFHFRKHIAPIAISYGMAEFNEADTTKMYSNAPARPQ